MATTDFDLDLPQTDGVRPLQLGATPMDASAALWARVRRGEPAAIGQVYDEHHQAVWAFARRLVGEAAAAEDLVHEVFVSLPRVFARYRGEGSARTFLFSVVVNHARHHVRAASRRRAAMRRLSLVPPSAPRNPEQITEGSELAEIMSRALDALPIDQRVAFVLCEVEERSSHEVAEIVGAPEATVRTRLHHAKRKLRETLAREGVRS
jgi:RNA polymerase sigma-70 factor (ECF subfamily)